MNWDDYKPVKLPYIKPLDLGTLVEFRQGLDTYYGKISRYLFPGYRFVNTNPWTLRYSITDYNDKTLEHIVEYTKIIKVTSITEIKRSTTQVKLSTPIEYSEPKNLPDEIIGIDLSNLL